jgi:hypothetical protein
MHRRRSAVTACLCAATIALPLLGGNAGADVLSTFDNDVEGWLSVNFPFWTHVPAPVTGPLSFDAFSGLPPGSVRIEDAYAETGIAAPSAYLGNKSGSYGGELTYDIYLRYTDEVGYPAVVLNGGTMSVYYDAPSPLVNQWTTMEVPLIEEGWRVSGVHDPVTNEQFLCILSDLVGLYINTEWHTGSDDTNVDNIRLSAGSSGAPEGSPVGELSVSVAPNPFGRAAMFAVRAEPEDDVVVRVFDVRGRLVADLQASAGDRGHRVLTWDGTTFGGGTASSGVYFYQATTGECRGCGHVVLSR